MTVPLIFLQIFFVIISYRKISTAIRAIQNPADDQAQYTAIQQYNSVVVGLHNYYRLATHIRNCRKITDTS